MNNISGIINLLLTQFAITQKLVSRILNKYLSDLTQKSQEIVCRHLRGFCNFCQMVFLEMCACKVLFLH